MSDVRLTATNPEDSSVVPVACNSSGELLLEEIPDQSFDGDLDGNLNVTGAGTFAGTVSTLGVYLPNTDGGVQGVLSVPPGTDDVRIANTGGVGNIEIGNDASGNSTTFFPDGSATFNGLVTGAFRVEKNVNAATGGGIEMLYDSGATGGAGGTIQSYDRSGNALIKLKVRSSNWSISDNGSAEFKSDVIVGSRGKQWTLVEQGGLCHMIEVTRAATADLVEPDEPKYPKLRDVFHELDLIEQALEQVMIKLRLDPPAGWPVWDGSDNLSATD